MEATQHMTDTGGLRIVFPVTRKQVEATILGAMSIVAPGGGPVTPDDVYFGHMKDGQVAFWPPKPEKKESA
jgi:hypothetical protein